MPEARDQRLPTLTAAAWSTRVWLIAGLGLASALVMLVAVAPIRQPTAYHAFHDTRRLLGIPNVCNVVSNLPFLGIGLAGLVWVWRRPPNLGAALRAPYLVVFVGLALTSVGSAYYHWAPDSTTLVWDRLPIATAFMALYAAVIGERISAKAGARLLLPFAVFGAASVVYWHLTDDLRPYVLAQFYPVATIPLILWLFPARYSRGADVLVAIGFYALAKLFEELDGRIYALGGIISGHTLKHLAAAAGCYWIYRMLVRRQPI